MTTAKQAVDTLCHKVYDMSYSQIVIDLVQDEIEEVLQEEDPRRDQVGALAYQCDILLETMNPTLEKDIALLTALSAALSAWSDDIESTSVILGLPRES